MERQNDDPDLISNKKRIISEIRQTLRSCLTDDNLKIAKIEYYEEHFGNIIVVLSTAINFDIVFIKDRSDLLCQFESDMLEPGNRLYLSEILEIIGYKPATSFETFSDMLCGNLEVIQQNWMAISQILGPTSLPSTVQKMTSIRKLQINRLLDRQQ